MKRRAHACQRDENEPAIVDILIAYGAYVCRMGTPFDLLVGYRGQWNVLEVKDGSKAMSAQKLKPLQVETLLLKIKGAAPVHVVRNPDEALCAIGAKPWPEVAA